MGKAFFTTLLGLILLISNTSAAEAAVDLKKLPRVVISSGGPYTSASETIQTFDGEIDIPREYVGQPLALVATNGSVSEPGYSWVRMFLAPGGSDTNLQQGANELGKLLVDENSFLSSMQVYIDMTGQLSVGRNRFHIEAVGRPGSVFYWEVRSLGAPQLSKLNPRVTVSGAQLDLAGMGFSVRPSENNVFLGPVQIPAEQSNGRMLQVYVPPGIPEGNYDLFVEIQGLKSNVIKIMVLPSPKVTAVYPVQLLPGQTMQIRGSGFSDAAGGNRVYIGRYPAPVVGANQQVITAIVPNMPPGEAKITVTANGATAQGNPTVNVTYMRR